MSLPWTNLHLLRTAQCAHGELVAAGMAPREAYFALDVVIDTTVATHQAVAALRALSQRGRGAGGAGSGAAPGPAQDARPGELEPLRGFDMLTRHWAQLGAAHAPDGVEDLPLVPEESWLERGFLDLKIDLLIDGLRARQDRRGL